MNIVSLIEECDPMAFLSPPPLSVYYCYDPIDLAFSRALDVYLDPLKRNGWIQTWDDQQITAGTEWEREREAHLRAAHLLVLLVSADFLASKSGIHMMQVALQRHQIGEAIAIPILIRAANWEETDLQTLQVLPRDQKAITSPDKDDIWREVTREIQRVIEAMRQWVFIAYSPEDQAFVEQLRQDMLPSGVLLWSLEKEQNTRDLGQDETRKAMRVASAVILIASPEAASSRLVKAQLALAEDYRRPILVVWARGEDWRASNPGKWRVHEVIDARDGRYKTAQNAVLMRLRQGMTALPPFVRPRPSIEPRNPYKGLKAFTRDDAGDFFGRETLIEELATTVETMLNLEEKGSPQIRLLPIIGPSGSGKSSVVMAGLLPYLQSGAIFGSEDWVYLDPMFPGTHPLEAVAVSLAPQFPARSAILLQREDFASDSVRALHTLASQLVQTSRRKIVLVVDQFEEVFTPTTSKEEQQHFLDLLITAATEPHGPVLVILTLRADFYDRPMQYPELYKLIDKRWISVLPMEGEDLRRVIEQPAQLPDVQLTFEGDLVGDLLFEMRGQVGALPLLQFTLDQLFERREGHHLTLRAYQEVGGVKGALAKHAEATYEKLPSDGHRKMVRDLFLRLLDAGDSEKDSTRRRAKLSELELSEAQQTAIMREVAERFVKARLLTISGSGDSATIEVSHEALIREWDRLREWLHKAREDFVLQKTLANDTAEWIRRGKPTDRLYRGSRLTEMQAWTERNHPNRDEAAFLQAAEDERKSQEALVIEQKEREAFLQRRVIVLQRRVITNQRWLIRALSVFSVVVVALGSLAGVFYVQANDAAREAILQKNNANLQVKIALSRTLVLEADKALSQNKLDLALLLSNEATQLNESYETRDSLLNSLKQSSPLVTVLRNKYQTPMRHVAFGPPGSGVLVASDDFFIYVWNTKRPYALPLILNMPAVSDFSNYVGGMALSPDGQKIAFSSPAGVWLQDIQTDLHLVQLEGKGDSLPPNEVQTFTPITFNENGRYLLSARCDHYTGNLCTSTKVSTFDVTTKQLVGRRSHSIPANVDTAVFNPRRQELATINSTEVLFWDVSTGGFQRKIPTGSTGEVTSIAFSPDGATLATVSGGNIKLWDVTTDQLLPHLPLINNADSINSIAFSPDGSQLAASFDTTALLFNIKSGERKNLIGNPLPKWGVAFSPDGVMLGAGSQDGTILLWKPSISSTINRQVPTSSVLSSLVFSPDGTVIFAGSQDGNVFLYDTKTEKPIDTLSTNSYHLLTSGATMITSLAINGGIMAAGRLDGTIVLWDVKSQPPKLLKQFKFIYPYPLYKVMLSAGGRLLMASGNGGIIRLWDVISGKSVLPVSYHENIAQTTFPQSLSPDGKLLAVGVCTSATSDSCVTNQIQFWDVTSGKVIDHTPSEDNTIFNVVFSPDGETLASSNTNGITLWNVAQQSPKEESLLALPADQPVESDSYDTIIFSPDGKRLASYSSPDRPFSFIVWNLTPPHPEALVRTFEEDGFSLGKLAFNPDGQSLATLAASGSNPNNGTFKLWDISVYSWQRQACSIANRNLTPEEWKQFAQDSQPLPKVCSSSVAT